MPKTKINDIQNKTIGELQAELDEQRASLAQLQLRLSVGREKNVTKKGKMKKRIARILTAIKEKEEKENNNA